MGEDNSKQISPKSRMLILLLLSVIPILIGAFLIVYATTTNAIYDTPLETFCIILGSIVIAASLYNLLTLLIKRKPKKPTLIFASSNTHKIEEMKELLKEHYKVLSLIDINLTEEIEETGETFLENSLIKAKAVTKFLKERSLSYPVIADDSGLCVDALEGKPGVYSARYAGDHSHEANRAKLLEEMKLKKNRAAHFECCIVKMTSDESYEVFTGQTHGEILKQETGSKEFGYNCLFFSKDLQKAFGEATLEERNSVSHRGRAIEKMLNDSLKSKQ